MELNLYPKQIQALKALNDSDTKQVLFGGGAGGGKSHFGCEWLLLNVIQYPGSRWLLGRARLKTLKETTLLTLFEVLRTHGFQAGIDYVYNKQDSIITFANGSTIFLKDLFHYPADPEFDELGSTEYTGAFIDEAQQVVKKARDVILSRLRWKTREFKIRGKILMSCNPADNFLNTEFYQPWKKGELPSDLAFIQSLADDNPSLAEEYLETLDTLPEDMKQRLRYGDWDYKVSSNQLIIRAWLDVIRTDKYPTKGKKTIAVDVAREGDDRTIIGLKIGKTLVDLQEINVPVHEQADISGMIATEIINYANQHQVGYADIWVDAVGVGGGVVDALRGRNWYVNSYKGGGKVEERPSEITEYDNIRAYSFWTLREKVQNQKARILNTVPFYDELVRELTNHHYETNDKLIKIEKKSKIKLRIGKSPDLADVTAMLFGPPPVLEFAVLTA